MPYTFYPAQYRTYSTPLSASPSYVPNAALAMGGVGAVIGAASSAAKNIRKVQKGETSNQEAVKNVLKEAAGTGLATAAGTVAVRALGARGFLSLLGVMAVAVGAKYVWDAATEPEKK